MKTFRVIALFIGLGGLLAEAETFIGPTTSTNRSAGAYKLGHHHNNHASGISRTARRFNLGMADSLHTKLFRAP